MIPHGFRLAFAQDKLTEMYRVQRSNVTAKRLQHERRHSVADISEDA